MRPEVTICECFARDGLQHEPEFVATTDKIALIDAFTTTGFPRIEATSYSHPERVPAFRDASDVLAGISRRPGVWYKATCPNRNAVERALADLAAGRGANEISLLASATEAHTEHNLRTSRAGQWQRIEEMARIAGGRFRLVGVISVALGCPFEGAVDPHRVAEDARRFAALGARLVTIGDTTGLATPSSVRRLFRILREQAPEVSPIAHFHDTRGAALANCLAAFEEGCRHFDSSFGGVGGHPAAIRYGEGHTGNVATEDLVNLLEAEGITTGLDLDRVMAASRLCEQVLKRELDSKVARAGFGGLSRGKMQHA
ncbi:hydroxymethylglutaryl-CoA lyase [Rhodoligotrophos defluvii]|uniref:hydroxymethylglutaryl-CoA lyase n=1 Tax=Rhodoligotrophos defluvii TaxID=2561934 RepID=UPI0010C93C57|nr:hydroxymethylglutaryl-CoA lyase [Rhodoligotrophos defluvii]